MAKSKSGGTNKAKSFSDEDLTDIRVYLAKLSNSDKNPRAKSVPSEAEQVKLMRYEEILGELSAKYEHIRDLFEKYPKLPAIMNRMSVVREILLTTPSDKIAVESIPGYLKDRQEMTLKHLQDMDDDLVLDKTMSYEDNFERYGDKSRAERIDAQYNILVAMFRSDALSSSMPGVLLERETADIKSILGHIPTQKEATQSLLDDFRIICSGLSLDGIQETDKLLVAGQEQLMVDFALENESSEAIDYIVTTRGLQRYLGYLEEQRKDPAELFGTTQSSREAAPHDISFKPVRGKEALWNNRVSIFFRELQKAGFIRGHEQDFIDIFSGVKPKGRIDLIGTGAQKNLSYILHQLINSYKLIRVPTNSIKAIATWFSFEGRVIAPDKKSTGYLRKLVTELNSHRERPANVLEIDKIFQVSFTE